MTGARSAWMLVGRQLQLRRGDLYRRSAEMLSEDMPEAPLLLLATL